MNISYTPYLNSLFHYSKTISTYPRIYQKETAHDRTVKSFVQSAAAVVSAVGLAAVVSFTLFS
jgi:hypothetical protein